MVKVKDEPAMAEPNPTTTTSKPLPSGATATTSPPTTTTSNPYIPRKPRVPHNHAHHHHHPHFQHYTYYHHCTYPPPPTTDATSEGGPGGAGTSPAKFYFGPGFEPQQQPGGGGGGGYGVPPPAGPSQNNNQGNQEYVVFFHVNPGVTISFQMGDNLEILRGPVTVPMVSTNSSPPIPMPMQVPQGHIVQQIVDESGTLRHVILGHHPPSLVPLPSHNPQHYGAGPGNSTNQSQQFYPGLPTGFPPQHFHSNMPPTNTHPTPSPTHLGHSPPPPPLGGPPNPTSYYNKDERTQRQHIKLKKKLHDKQQNKSDTLLPTRKELLVNGLKRTNVKEKGMNSVGTSEDGEESSVPDEEDSFQIVTDILSSVQAPKVSELSSRSALLQWAPPTRLSESASNDSHEIDISESDLRYEVLLSDKSKEMKFKSIYSGASLSCRIQDLKPGQEYSVCLQVHLDEMQGFATDPVKFFTPPCEPDQPQPPKLIHRTKHSLQLRWNTVNDNGSHIVHYIVEYDEGKGEGFVEFYKGKGKTNTLTKLQPATLYKFRMCAVNDVGRSLYSDVIGYQTFDNPPTQPGPPTLSEATVQSLHLQWNQRPKDDEFILQMNDVETKYGFLNVYHGRENFHVCRGLNRFSDYSFRLRAKNDDGLSLWSEEVTYRTLPDRPARPSKPIVKGRIHAHSFKLKWEPPSDTGGAEITRYVLEVNSGSGYETVYAGMETEAVCDKLTPGTTYQLRVSCFSAGGCSNYSDPCTVTTDAISPGQCSAPRLQGKPKATSVLIRWTEPDYNGGAPVLDYEVEMLAPDSSRSTVHKSKEMECFVSGLSPGNEYVFAVRAVNRIGPGAWSDPLKITSGAAPPAAPDTPTLQCRSPFHISVEWQEPPSNGAQVSEYRLEMSPDADESKFHCVYQGAQLSYEIKGLQPFHTYYVRVQAGNCAGFSGYSQVAATVTPAAPPSAVSLIKSESTPTSVTLHWNPSASNGSDITHYNIEIGDRVISTEAPVSEYTIENLQPDTNYKIKIQAVNHVAPGPFSASLRTSTLRLPPTPPRLECSGIGHNYLKLKWGEGKNTEYIQYCVEMRSPRGDFQCVYKGTALACKVNKLQELTAYKFRMNAASDAGVGDWSEEVEFRTSIAPPGAVKAPKLVEVEQRQCTIEWFPAKNSFADAISYQVQLCKGKEQVFKQVCRTSDPRCTLENLEPGTEYSARVCPMRLTEEAELPGPFSPTVNFATSATESGNNGGSGSTSSKPLSGTSSGGTSSAHAHKHHHFHHSVWQTVCPTLKRFPDEYRTYLYVVLVMLVGIVISLVLASFL